MTKEELIEKAVAAAKEAQIRDDVCARSAMYGLKQVFEYIPEELVTASLSLAGGSGGASASCGAYCAGQLAVGMTYNSTMEEEKTDPSACELGCMKFEEFRDRFLAEKGTVLCPELQKQLFGRSFALYTPEGRDAFMAIEDHHIRCAEVVGDAVRIACEMLLEDEKVLKRVLG